MNKILRVAGREYAETVKTRTFLLSLLLTPVLIVGMVLASIFLQEKSVTESRPPRQVTVIDRSNELADEIEEASGQYNQSNPHRPINFEYEYERGAAYDPDHRLEELKTAVGNGEIDGLLVVEKDVPAGGGKASLYSRNVTDIEFTSTIQRLLNAAVFNMRFRMHDLSPQLIDELQRSVPLEQFDLSRGREKSGNRFAAMMVPFFFMFLMFFGIFVTGQGLLMSVIEEKSSRVIEVLLAAVTPFELMAGKIVGQSAVGLFLIGIYGMATYITASARGMGDLLNTDIIGYFLIYFVLGFLLISALFAAFGSACNSAKEAQNLTGPLTMIVLVPMIAWFYIVQHPESSVSLFLSFIPPMTPMVMILRIAAQPDLALIQIALSVLLLAASVLLVIWLAAKIFRVGILMYGKPPSLRELLRWLRYD